MDGIMHLIVASPDLRSQPRGLEQLPSSDQLSFCSAVTVFCEVGDTRLAPCRSLPTVGHLNRSRDESEGALPATRLRPETDVLQPAGGSGKLRVALGLSLALLHHPTWSTLPDEEHCWLHRRCRSARNASKENVGSSLKTLDLLSVLLNVPKRVSGPDDPDRRRAVNPSSMMSPRNGKVFRGTAFLCDRPLSVSARALDASVSSRAVSLAGTTVSDPSHPIQGSWAASRPNVGKCPSQALSTASLSHLRHHPNLSEVVPLVVSTSTPDMQSSCDEQTGVAVCQSRRSNLRYQAAEAQSRAGIRRKHMALERFDSKTAALHRKSGWEAGLVLMCTSAPPEGAAVGPADDDWSTVQHVETLEKAAIGTT
ncbi:hypothetical protein PANT_9d00269 [Moesziomyces antarcticus T-34]|uniref:Uncharacterized protein n=1 Tax=Pseudozyma antarctica (strain T-34) TaxID=1151754 RepID=M9LP36_PSEA3|nr:hypothetical protein PANT_9d00269 [Moesziomyces antarcticus T-34]